MTGSMNNAEEFTKSGAELLRMGCAVKKQQENVLNDGGPCRCPSLIEYHCNVSSAHQHWPTQQKSVKS